MWSDLGYVKPTGLAWGRRGRKQKTQERLLRFRVNRGERKRREKFGHVELEMPAEYFSGDVKPGHWRDGLSGGPGLEI